MPLTIAMLVCLFACQGDDNAPLTAYDVRVYAPMPGATMTAAYLSLRNSRDTPIQITAITSPEFVKVEMHETIVRDGIARMRPLDEVVVPANETLEFKRGGKHLMLMQPAGTGDSVTMLLMDENAVLLTITTSFAKRDN